MAQPILAQQKTQGFKIKKIVLSGLSALAILAASTTLTSAACLQGCTKITTQGDWAAGSIAGAGGFSNGFGVKKRTSYSETGTVNEGDLTINIDKNGAKKIDGTFRSAGYGVQTNTVKARGGSFSVSGSGTTGGIRSSLKVKKTGKN